MRSAEDCRLWSGSRVSFPVELETLALAIEFAGCESCCLVDDLSVVAFGQLVPKAGGRFHIARVIVDPGRRGESLGRAVTTHLIERARVREAELVSLNVASDNRAAIALYASLGFGEAPRPEDEPNSTSLYMVRAAPSASAP